MLFFIKFNYIDNILNFMKSIVAKMKINAKARQLRLLYFSKMRKFEGR